MDIIERLREHNEPPFDYIAHEAAGEIERLRGIIREIVSQIDQGGYDGKVFARDNCIQRAREALQQKRE